MDPENGAGRTPFEITIEKAVYRGLGLARREGRVVFVPGGLPGDVWRVEPDGGLDDYLRVRHGTLVTPGPGRRSAPCAHHARCGGCSYQALGYAEQRKVKRAILVESLTRAGLAPPTEVEVHTGPEHGWRMRGTLHRDEATGRLGFYEEGTHSVVAFDECAQLSERLNEGIRELGRVLGSLGPWATQVRHASFAESADESRRVILLKGPPPAGKGDVARLAAGWHGLGWLVGSGRHQRVAWSHGTPYAETVVAGMRLRGHVHAFFQANRFLVESLALAVAGWVADGPVLDLYAGAGLFSLALARAGLPVRAIEWNAFAVADLKANARAADLGSGIEVSRADVESFLAASLPDPALQVIVDPPRQGLSRGVIASLARLRPARLVYVSCDPVTLARDLGRFADRGYHCDQLEAFDMFPTTFHIEAVARLRRTPA